MKNVSRLLGHALLVCLALAPLTAPAVAPALVECPFSTLGGDTFGGEGFYVPSFPGVTLKDVTLQLQFPASGTYSLTLTARLGTFDGTLLGQAGATATVASDRDLPVVFHFSSPAVPSGSTVTFAHAVVSGPAGIVFYAVLTPAGCPVVETEGFAPPLSAFRRSGVAVTITGDPDPQGSVKTVVSPANASIHGANGTFFHSDLNLFNVFSENLSVTARYRCFSGQSCGSGTATFTMNAFAAKSFKDVVATLFGSHETAGAIELTYRAPLGLDAISAVARVYTPALPNPTNGASVPGLTASAATGTAVFVGLGNNGGNLQSGFRTNAGAYNGWARPAHLTFTLYRNDGATIGSGTLLGSYSDTWGPNESKQVNDVFAKAGAGAAVATDAILVVTSDLPVFSYVTIIDNVTGDSVVLGPTSF